MNDKFNIKPEVIEEARTSIFDSNSQLTEKVKIKREAFLMKVPLLSLLYQKKGSQNFQIVVNSIKLVKTGFGEIIFNSTQNRTFNIILRGFVMLFIKDKERDLPKFYKKLMPGDHFGQRMIFGKEELESARSVSQGYLLQMDMKPFFHAFAGHFSYEELKQEVNDLKHIWVFRNLKLPFIQRILLSSQSSRHIRGHILFKQGDEVDHLLVILNGEVTLSAIKNGKLKSFSILTKLQVYGVQEITDNKPYLCTGVCTSDYTVILKVDKEIVEEIFQKELLPSMINSRKRLSTQFQETYLRDSKQIMTYSSLNGEMSTKKKKIVLENSRVETEISPFDYYPLNKMELQNNLFKREVQLKHSIFRQIRQDFIKQTQRDTLYSTKRLSSFINKDCTYDKEIILNYLERKQQKYQQALRKEVEFQSKKILIGPELRVTRSSAVKNHKRKLKNSRKRHCLSLEQI